MILLAPEHPFNLFCSLLVLPHWCFVLLLNIYSIKSSHTKKARMFVWTVSLHEQPWVRNRVISQALWGVTRGNMRGTGGGGATGGGKCGGRGGGVTHPRINWILSASKWYATSSIQTIPARQNAYNLRAAAGSIVQPFTEVTAPPAPPADTPLSYHLILATKCAPQETTTVCLVTTLLQFQSDNLLVNNIVFIFIQHSTCPGYYENTEWTPSLRLARVWAHWGTGHARARGNPRSRSPNTSQVPYTSFKYINVFNILEDDRSAVVYSLRGQHTNIHNTSFFIEIWSTMYIQHTNGHYNY